MTGLLADTSSWIAHHRQHDPVLAAAIAADDLWTHELVIAELSLGSIADRDEFLSDLRTFRRVPAFSTFDLIAFAERESLVSTGVGFVDASLLHGLSKLADVRLWTRDKRLAAQAERLGLGYTPG